MHIQQYSSAVMIVTDYRAVLVLLNELNLLTLNSTTWSSVTSPSAKQFPPDYRPNSTLVESYKKLLLDKTVTAPSIGLACLLLRFQSLSVSMQADFLTAFQCFSSKMLCKQGLTLKQR